MDSENRPITAAEELMRRSQFKVLISRRVDLKTVGWDLDLCSPFWRLYVNDRSGAFLKVGQKRVNLSGGKLWLVPAWLRFQTGFHGRISQDYVHFQFTGLPSGLLPRFFQAPIELENQPALAALMEKWRSGFAEAPDFSHLCWAGALIHAAVAAAISDWSEVEQGDYLRWVTASSDIQPALERIEDRFAEPPRNRDLARLCHFSEDHFIRKFRKILGMTPAEYGRERRVAIAAEWLTETNRTLEDIAESAGFTDRFHLSRILKARLGLPPAAYRRMHRLET